MSNTIHANAIADAMEIAGMGEDVDTINDSYTGRNTTGAPCLSFVIAGTTRGITRKVAQFAFALGANAELAEEYEDACDQLAQGSSLLNALELDSLGRDTIAYFPGWKLTSDTEDTSGTPLKDDETAHVNAPK